MDTGAGSTGVSVDMTSDRGDPIEAISWLVRGLLDRIAKPVTWQGAPLSPEEGAAPDGALPVIIFHAARQVDLAHSRAAAWFACFTMQEDENALTGYRVTAAPQALSLPIAPVLCAVADSVHAAAQGATCDLGLLAGAAQAHLRMDDVLGPRDRIVPEGSASPLA